VVLGNRGGFFRADYSRRPEFRGVITSAMFKLLPRWSISRFSTDACGSKGVAARERCSGFCSRSTIGGIEGYGTL